MCVCGGFRKYGYPHIIHLNWIFHYKQSILGHHHFRKPHIYLRKPNLLGFGVGPPLCSTNLANKVGDHLVERMDWFNCYSFHGCFRMEECPRMIHVFFGTLIGWGSGGGVFGSMCWRGRLQTCCHSCQERARPSRVQGGAHQASQDTVCCGTRVPWKIFRRDNGQKKEEGSLAIPRPS